MKMTDYFVGFVKGEKVIIEKEEFRSYKWATYEEALNAFEYKSRKQVLKEAKKYIENESRK